jgi:recombination protein RecT
MSNNLAVFMKRPDVLSKFTDMMGDNGKSYVQSVLIAVSASPELMKCSAESIFRSSLRAASLGLSCDPALKQAWLVPYNRKVGDSWVKEAQFQPHYKGLYTLAMRTGKYWQINVTPIYEGQRVLENPLTGLHVVQEGNGFVGDHPGRNPALIDVTVRRKKDQKIIGWLGYFKTKKGFEKSVWMSSLEIEDHARKYVKDYDKSPNWSDPEKRQVMEMKTVLRQLLSWADMSGSENTDLVEALQADDPIDAEVEDVHEGSATMSIAQARDTVVKIGKNEKLMSELDVATLNRVYLDESSTPEQRTAAVILLADEGYDPPESQQAPRPAQEPLKELGY